MSGGLGQKRRLDQDHCVGGRARFSPSVKKTSTSAFACHMRSTQLAPTRSPPTVCPMRPCQQRWIPKPPKDQSPFSLFIPFSYRAARGPSVVGRAGVGSHPRRLLGSPGTLLYRKVGLVCPYTVGPDFSAGSFGTQEGGDKVATLCLYC